MPYNGTTPPPKPQDPELAARHNGHYFTKAISIVACTLLGMGLLAGGCGLMLAQGLNNLGDGWHSAPRRHLHAIPISANTCPNVVAMHKAANAFQRVTPIFGGLFDTNGHVLTWPETRAQLLRAANRLDFVVVASTPTFPPRIQRYLAKVHQDLTAGRVQLVVARNEYDFSKHTDTLLGDGQLAFGYAGDLVGRQCRVPLGADGALLAAIPAPPTTTLPAPNTAQHRKH